MKYKCIKCYATQESRFRKPEGWVKYKSPDGNTLFFCSQKCLKEWSSETVELHSWKKRLKNLLRIG